MAARPDRIPFPKNVDEFGDDDPVSFSKVDNRWILEDDDDTEWEYNEAARKWMPTLDEREVEEQNKAYRIEGVDESEPTAASKKRKKDDADGEENGSKKRNKENRERKNTAVYVTNLPLDATREEIEDVFGKYGMIAESIDTGEKRVKMYTDEQDIFKGDALITYFREESVQLAINMLDDYSFRLGVPNENGNMRVAKADMSYRKEKAPEGEAPVKKYSAKEKKKIRKINEAQKSKLMDWPDDDPQAIPDTSSRYDKVVVMKHMFTLAELEEDPAALLEIKEDIRDECSQYGEVTNVVLFDKEPSGVVTVRFSNALAAKKCVETNSGRSFAGRVVEAYIADGTERFKKSSNKARTEEEEAEEEARLQKFGDWLNKQEEDNKA